MDLVRQRPGWLIVNVVDMLANAVFLAVAVLVGYGWWAWKRGKVQRKSTKTALVCGLIAVVALVIAMTLLDFVVAGASDTSTVGLVAFLVAMLLVALGLIAFAGAVVSLLVRLVNSQTAVTAPPITGQPPSV